jgi:putative MFS transporter
MTLQQKQYAILSLPVIVGALGYFVDIYDLLLFSIIRVKSLKALGLSVNDIKNYGAFIISVQMVGMLLGGIVWGIMGDKKGRLSVLFGSIIMYSLANVANGMVQTTTQYAILRFVAGFGLAGELGAGITLVSELLPKQKRGIATSVMAGIGLTGAVAAYFISKLFDWRVCYYIGGALGFMLLLLRVNVFESGMFHHVKQMNVKRGNFFMLFNNWNRFKKYLLSILIGLPNWYVVGILVTFSKEFGVEFKTTSPVDPSIAVMTTYVGVSIGGILIGFISQWLQSRKKALIIFLAINFIAGIIYFQQHENSALFMYVICAVLGFATGFWSILVTIGAEQFGTNLRATAATTIPNMVRGSLPLVTLLFYSLQGKFSYVQSGMITGIIITIITFTAAFLIEETFHKDLNFLEM